MQLTSNHALQSATADRLIESVIQRTTTKSSMEGGEDDPWGAGTDERRQSEGATGMGSGAATTALGDEGTPRHTPSPLPTESPELAAAGPQPRARPRQAAAAAAPSGQELLDVILTEVAELLGHEPFSATMAKTVETDRDISVLLELEARWDLPLLARAAARRGARGGGSPPGD